MSTLPHALWLNVSPALEKLDRPLLDALSRHIAIAQWQYCQTQDEPMSLEIALVLLHDYLKHHDRPIHLLGHGTSGLLGLLYARRHPERVRSLTLLSVGVHPAVDWHAHYYTQFQFLPCSRETLLMQTVYHLFGHQSRSIKRDLLQVLERDLRSSLSPHTLYRRVSFFPGGVSVPLMVCGSQNDVVVDPNLLQGWQPWLKEGDRLWQCPDGRHFFHYFYPTQVSKQIVAFWHAQPSCQAATVGLESVNISA
ncbi:alpha/beta fold hydrolase [Leptodesmis sp.]|uniref:alpha/beta fold hydrolase n=1 Tax=Leptodesmis sp. TaxID=3100501 RepID=UPI0040534692